jgi:sulfite reductase (ferredoxin)
MQSDRDVKGKVKDFQFMLRLSEPAGELPADLYRLLDDLSTNEGKGDLRTTMRQWFQMHGIVKGNSRQPFPQL